MSRKLRVVDMVCGVALVGVLGASVLAQAGGPDPIPFKKTCPARDDIDNPGGGPDFSHPSFPCNVSDSCGYAIIYNQWGMAIGAIGVCIVHE